MAHQLYTDRLELGHASYPVDHVVPAGVRWVVRYVTGFNSSGISDATLHLIIVDYSITFLQWSLAPSSWQGFDMRVILQEGETLRLDCDDTIDLTVNGWVLQLP